MRTLAIVGTAAGCGVTTLAALAFAGLRMAPGGAPHLLGPEHGDLVERAGGDEVHALDPQKSVWDAGVRTPASARRVLGTGGVTLVVATPTTELGSADARQFVADLARDDPRMLDRVALVRTGVYGRASGSSPLTSVSLASFWIPYDRSLASRRAITMDPRVYGRRARAEIEEWQRFSAWALDA